MDDRGPMSTEQPSFANFSNLATLEAFYERYLKDPESVDRSWRLFFEGMQLGLSTKAAVQLLKGGSPDLRVYNLIHAYRTFGHLLARVNPIATQPPADVPELNLENLGFKPEEVSVSFPTVGFLKEEMAPLQTIIDALKETYCRTIGIEYMGLGEPAIERWLQEKIEPGFALHLSSEEKVDILHHLNRAEMFESFIHTKYVGQKRFSLEGGETLIPMLVGMIEQGSDEGVGELVLGMAHRGRLNVLANILNKSYTQIFGEFEDHYAPDEFEGTGDVKYHKGFSGGLKLKNGKEVSITLSANPSHLESVDPVVEGQVRAKQEIKGDKSKRREVVPVLIHGDAAIAGQGVVYETLQLMRLNGYATGGTIHFVINNQIGFTTLPKDTRSTRYCTDIARAFGSPVFHVNAEDPEACVAVAKIAIRLRQAFQCDVFIDLNCYRKYGHNESDEPHFTQPLEYKLIGEKKPIRTLYRERLIQEGVLAASDAEKLEEEFKTGLKEAQEAVQTLAQKKKEEQTTIKPDLFAPFKTKVALETLKKLAESFCHVPEGFHINSKIEKRLLHERLEMINGDVSKASIDWGMGEHLAYATLLIEGVHVRIAGQDVRRGTFSHRHGMWVDQENEQRYFPLAHLQKGQALFDIFNSPLSEFAALGFEFGYSLSYPKSLTLWEAQFGDFANGAQVMIDQYFASSEQKWGNATNLTLLLPHGYEGQGPEHSSARIERFLQLAGDENIQVVELLDSCAALSYFAQAGAACNEKAARSLYTQSDAAQPTLYKRTQRVYRGVFSGDLG